MGAACCVAAKSRTISNGPLVESFQRNAHYSPPWSFRRENRGRVAGEDVYTNWVDDAGGGNRVNFKSDTFAGTAFAFEEGSPTDTFQTSVRQKSLVSDGNSENLRLPSSVSADEAIACDLVKSKESIKFPSASCPSTVKLSPAPSVSSPLTSPLSSQSHAVLPTSTPSSLHHSPSHQLLHQLSDSRIPEYKSPTSISEETSSYLPPTWGNDSARESNGGSSDGWPIPGFSELMTTRKERWSFDSDASGFSRDRSIRSVGHSGPPSCDIHSCGICMKLLTERSSLRWSSHVTSNELAVVSVLICGHVYHAECLENMTPELNQYDPDCPVCIFGEKRMMKMSGKALKSELDSKARKRLRKRIVDSDLNSKFVFKSGGVEGRGPLLNSSLSMKSSRGKPFLRRHFSFGFKTNKPMSENLSIRQKVFSWGKLSKD